MKTLDQLTVKDLAASLRSTTCPSCTGSKGERKSVCGCCWHELPAGIQRRLYKRIGEGYEQAFADAMDHLLVARPTLPPDLQA